MSTSELARREERAQGGIIQFAEEMQAIRDGNLYPGAKQAPDAWGVYCKERWGQGRKAVDDTIRALPVLRRLSTGRAAPDEPVSVTSAATVATLDESVQDAILEETTNRDDVRAKAKAVRKTVKTAEYEGREATVEEQIAAAKNVKAAKPKKPKKRHDSKFTAALSMAYAHIQDAADIAQNTTLDGIENEYGWNRVEKIDYELARLRERLFRPETARDISEEFSELLGEQS